MNHHHQKRNAARRGGAQRNRIFKRFAILLSIITCLIWYTNVHSIRYLDTINDPNGSRTSAIYNIKEKKRMVEMYSSLPTNKTIQIPILIPSHNRKFHLKETLAKDLESMVTIYPNHTYSIQKDISSLLSFAIIGMSKTGTTSLLKMLSNSTSIIPKERCDLVVDDVLLLVNSLHSIKKAQSTQHGQQFPTGIKCPQDVSSQKSIQNYKKYFPKTKLIVGLRHPILWFESLYNFNARNMNKMAPTKKLERCIKGSHGVCAWRVNVADFLSQLNKTPMMEEDELQYMNLRESTDKASTDKRQVGPVFLYEVNQLQSSASENDSFRKDLGDFIGIEHELLPEVPHINTAGVLDFVPGVKEFSESKMIDICDDDHIHIRSILLEKARSSSAWILTYLLKSNDVHVSSRDNFVKKLENWSEDPCIERRKMGSTNNLRHI